MKTRIIKYLVVISFLGGLLSACSKESALDVSIINYDTYEPNEIDNCISKNLTDLYNIEVIYRYSRNQHDLNRNISPPDESKVIPQMRVVIEGFLKVYEKVGGKTFVKVYSPKQFVLFGSHNYRDDGVVIAGTADGGRRITLRSEERRVGKECRLGWVWECHGRDASTEQIGVTCILG